MIVQNTCVNKYAYLKEQGPETDEGKKDIKNERIQTLKVSHAVDNVHYLFRSQWIVYLENSPKRVHAWKIKSQYPV